MRSSSRLMPPSRSKEFPAPYNRNQCFVPVPGEPIQVTGHAAAVTGTDSVSRNPNVSKPMLCKTTESLVERHKAITERRYEALHNSGLKRLGRPEFGLVDD